MRATRQLSITADLLRMRPFLPQSELLRAGSIPAHSPAFAALLGRVNVGRTALANLKRPKHCVSRHKPDAPARDTGNAGPRFGFLQTQKKQADQCPHAPENSKPRTLGEDIGPYPLRAAARKRDFAAETRCANLFPLGYKRCVYSRRDFIGYNPVFMDETALQGCAAAARQATSANSFCSPTTLPPSAHSLNSR